MIDPLRNQRRPLQILGLLVIVVLSARLCVAEASTTVASFNIEEFPKSAEQIDGAFEAIRGLHAPIVALQEITDPSRFRREASSRLGGNWRAIFPGEPPDMSPGILYDAGRFELVGRYTHEETVVYEGARPVLEAEFQDRRDDERRLELFVVHLKAGSDGVPVRRRQHHALRDILDDHVQNEFRTVLLGDFNSTGDRDRRMLRTTADRTSLRWLSRRTECTGYWRPDDQCRSFKLDHILAGGLGGRSLSRGPCETLGCDPGDQCPIFHDRVSDHCPITATVTTPP